MPQKYLTTDDKREKILEILTTTHRHASQRIKQKIRALGAANIHIQLHDSGQYCIVGQIDNQPFNYYY